LVDGYDPEVIKEMMEERVAKETEEKTAVAKVWETAGGFSPTVGIIGAVLGLIHVMSNLSDSSKLGAGIAVAFVATVYGVGSANLLFLPIANKLKKIGQDEIMEMEIIYAAITGIQGGLNPRVIEEKLANIVGIEGGHEEKKAA
jgi:chemotaxis protein MotA